MDVRKLQSWWAHRQGLDGSLHGAAPAEVLRRAGWARSVGGSCAYLTMFARAGISRADAEKAQHDLQIHELPAARGCVYVLPAEDFALGLRLSRVSSNAEMAIAAKLGVTEREVSRLEDKVIDALSHGPLDPAGLKDTLGAAVRKLGEEGKKKGQSTTLPLALGRLQSAGEIRRIPHNGRLDTQKFLYARWSPNPLPAYRLTDAECAVELARHFFRWIGPATLGEFQWFSGLGVKASKDAIAPLKLVAAPGLDGTGRLLHPDDVEAFARFKSPARPGYALVSSVDSMILLRRDFNSLLAAGDFDREVAGERGIVGLGGVGDLPSNAVLKDGRIVGLWEFDADNGAIAWSAFEKPSAAFEQAVALTEEFVRDQIGDARSFSLDTPKSRAKRIAHLRAGG